MIILVPEVVRRISSLIHNSSSSNLDLLHIKKHGVLNCDMLDARFWQERLT